MRIIISIITIILLLILIVYAYRRWINVTEGLNFGGDMGFGFARGRLIISPSSASAAPPAAAADVNGAVTQVNALIPSGLIIMWHPNGNTLPAGWSICDGTNGTPNLSGSFIVASGMANAPGAKGGSNTITLTAAQMPSHNHGFCDDFFSDDNGYWARAVSGGYAAGAIPSPGGGNNNMVGRTGKDTSAATVYCMNKSTSNTGSGQSYDNRPSYYALIFIMKL